MNNNNRNNGQSVRPVRSAHQHLPETSVFCLTWERLFADLRQAYYDARRHKRNKPYQLHFEAHLEENLESLCDALWNRTYQPLPSSCFIVTDPKKREVFAANFRDRIVHHLYYNYTHRIYERTFIHDCYSCIKNRGTHYGIKRLEGHIRKESQNYTVPCYVMKMDIRGYFMHIDRRRLLEICLATINKMASHRVSRHRPEQWQEVVDVDFIKYLTEAIVLIDPSVCCYMKGQKSDWDGLPFDKSLFHSPEGCGLPIGNLTSQLFSNVYLNQFDQFMKRELHCRHYGRYVDDFYVVNCDKEWLKSLVPKVTAFLSNHLDLKIHEGKTLIQPVKKGVEYLGAFLLPYRTYTSRATLERMDAKLYALETEGHTVHVGNALNSYCGVLSHWNNFNVRQMMLLKRHSFTRWGMFDYEVRHFYD